MNRVLTLGAFALNVALGCQARTAPPSPPAAALEVHFQGCRDVTAGGECLILASTSTLTLWAEAPEQAQLEVLLDGERREVATTPVLGGLHFEVVLDRAPALLTVRRSTSAEWRLPIRPSSDPPALLRAERLRSSGDFEGARALLDPLLGEGDVGLRAKVLGQLGRIALAKGDYPAATQALEESIRLRRAAGSASGEIWDRCALAFLTAHRGDHAGAWQILEPVREVAGADLTGATWADQYRGAAALATVDFRRALERLAPVLIESERLGLREQWSGAAYLQVRALELLGRRGDARALLARIEDRIPAGPPCARAEALELAGGLELDLHPEQLQRARSLLEESAEMYAGACPKPRRRAFGLVQLGRTALASGAIDDAERFLARAKAAHAEPGVRSRMGQLELEADIADARQDPAAESKYRKLEVHGLMVDDPEVAWRSLLGRGRALERGRRAGAAIEVYQQAEDLLDRMRFKAPLGGGRETFLGDRTVSASHLVELLLRAGRTEDAVRAARRSRARALSAVAWPERLAAASEAERDRWYRAVSAYDQERRSYVGRVEAEWAMARDRLDRVRGEQERTSATILARLDEAMVSLGSSHDAVFAPLDVGPDEVVLLYHPLPSGWAGFAIDRGGVVARRIAREAGAERLLDTFSDRLEGRESVRFLPYGELDRIDFHATLWHGRPLAASLAVRYGVDVTAPAHTTTASTALLIDPYDELRTSAAEVTLAAEQLARRGWQVKRLSGSAATRTSIRDALATRIRFLQYSGHASFAGLDGWESHLGRPEHQLLTIGDILTLPAAPEEVLLSGCETAATESRAGSGLGLAQAFVLAGARWVVASTRPVRDADAARLVAELYAQPAELDVALRLQAAQKTLIDTKVDWAGFRVLVP